jgi:8-oxo-dGTP diphosphatase
MKILYGTTNDSKINHMKEMIKELEIEIISLKEVEKTSIKVIEDGKTPLENAKKKARKYFEEFKRPVFACDTGLYLEGLKSEDQPGVNVRRIKGKELSDDEMIEHYSEIARKNGGEIIGWYENAICLILSEEMEFSYQGIEISSEKFIISETPYQKRLFGFPLDSLSKNIQNGKYYLEIKNQFEKKSKMEDGFKRFFKKSLKKFID